MPIIKFLKWTTCVSMVFVGCVLAGCGQKGPLILPPKDATPRQIEPQVFPEDRQQQTENKDEEVPLGIQFNDASKKK